MFDGVLRGPIDRAVNPIGAAMARAGVHANAVTLAGLALGLMAAAVIAMGGALLLALALILASRAADGLDGAVARANIAGRGKTDFGGYLDITCDFIFYGAIPLAFALRDGANALPAAVLLMSFYMNGASFLAFAIFAAKRGLALDAPSRARGDKSLYFTAGLAEGFETIAVFAAFCLWPLGFSALSYGFAALCFASGGARMMLAYRTFGAGK
ncbi:MAG: CDP-alcohol phosphatidyltransferase family protein [Cypionkella sp.]|nr:CDP-alcohol phosphatidyltransferase family protein [Cypionkella sp.]